MSKPIIGIAANQLIHPTETFSGLPVTYTPQGFVNAIIQAGGQPWLIPIHSAEEADAYVRKVDKLLLAGGQDIDPQFYGEDPHRLLQETNAQRDFFELALIQSALNQKKPIFTVCRGTQLLNVALGGTLYQDLSLFTGETIKHDQQPTAPHFTTHRIEVNHESLLSNLLPETYRVNSYHHQAIKQLATPLRIAAQAPDGIIEAVESSSLRLLGVQWHPELTHARIPEEQKLFDFFVHSL